MVQAVLELNCLQWNNWRKT